MTECGWWREAMLTRFVDLVGTSMQGSVVGSGGR